MTKHFFYNQKLSHGMHTLPEGLSHRMRHVLRFKEGQEVRLFNGIDGLWQGAVMALPKRGGACVNLLTHVKPQPNPIEKHLFLALTKRDAFERSLRFAAELGVSHIHPLKTDFSMAIKLNYERLETIVVEAAEQCERLTIPKILPIAPLTCVTEHTTGILWGDESSARKQDSDDNLTPKKESIRQDGCGYNEVKTEALSVLVGPEGGFSAAEKSFLRMQPKISPICLAKTILRADTAVAVALSRLPI